MAKIYEKDRLYTFLRPFVDFLIKRSYSKVEVYGEENLPQNGAIILAPNHCNTLMDALVVLRARKEQTVYGARADIFNNKIAGKLLTFLKILPMVRMRDGLRNVTKNRDTLDQIVETLDNGVKYCMFCEGRHRPKHSLLPINKGIVRIALAANEQYGDRKPVYIVPLGIEYGDYFRYRSTSMLQYGHPINVTEFVREHSDLNEAEIYRELMSLIQEGMSSLITFIPDDEDYAAKWTLTRIWASRKGSLKKRLESNRAAAARAEKADRQVLDMATAFEADRLAGLISYKSLGRKHPKTAILLKCMAALLFLPVFIYSAVMASPIWGIALAITSKMKDKAFRNTGRYGVLIAAYPVLLIVWAVLLFVFLKWYIALPLYLLAAMSNSIFYSGSEFFRVLASDFRLLFNDKVRSGYDALKALY